MLINWMTVAAQIINFLILVWLLKKFLYRPIVNTLDARKLQIETALKEAQEQKQSAEQARLTLERKKAELDHLREEQLDALTKEIDAMRAQMKEEARREVKQQKELWEQELQTEKTEVYQECREKMVEALFGVATKALRTLTTQSLESCAIASFLQQLPKIPQGPLIVRTAFPLVPEAQKEIEQKLLQAGGTTVQFSTLPELIGGIELLTDGQKYSWNIKDYLAQEQDVITHE